MPPDRQIQAHEIHLRKGLDVRLSLSVALSTIQVKVTNSCERSVAGSTPAITEDPPCREDQNTLNLPMPLFPRWSGRASLVVKVLDCGWLVTSSRAQHHLKDPQCRGAMHVKSVQSSNVLPLVWCDVVVRKEGFQLRCSPRHLTMIQNYVIRHQQPSCS
ncbi:hypothetical protein TNCV_2685241 [Trichonephila clavipes]|nr:hypothetical protein TNCV_2685241 [Trichonephila clavipes]